MIPIYVPDRQKELISFLTELSENVIQLGDEAKRIECVDRFIQIYIVDEMHYFRHSYGTLSGSLIEKSRQNSDYSWIEILLENLVRLADTLYKKIPIEDTEDIESNRNIQVYKSLLKLHDHISSENIRLQQVYRQYHEEANKAKSSYMMAKQLSDETKRTSIEAKKLSNKAKALSNEAKAKSDKAIELSKDAANIKTEVVTILSIFAAIILMFSGGLTILGSAISSMHDVIIYKVLVVTLLCIVGVFDAIFLLLYVAAKISSKSLLVTCAYGECAKDRCQKTLGKGRIVCNPVFRLLRRLPYVFWFNFLIFVIIFLTILAWALDAGGLARWIQGILWWHT